MRRRVLSTLDSKTSKMYVVSINLPDVWAWVAYTYKPFDLLSGTQGLDIYIKKKIAIGLTIRENSECIYIPYNCWSKSDTVAVSQKAAVNMVLVLTTWSWEKARWLIQPCCELPFTPPCCKYQSTAYMPFKALTQQDILHFFSFIRTISHISWAEAQHLEKSVYIAFKHSCWCISLNACEE